MVNNEEAKALLAELLTTYREKKYDVLKQLVGNQDTNELIANSGTKYQIEFQAVWDDKQNGDIRIIGTIDDGGLRSSYQYLINPQQVEAYCLIFYR